MKTLQPEMQTRRQVLRTAFAAALTGALLAACAGSPTKESTGELIDDSLITSKVKAAMLADQNVSAIDVSVDTFKGRVQLSGFVKSADERQRAELLARSVRGVKEVSNQIEVR